MVRQLLLAVAGFFLFAAAHAQQTEQAFVQKMDYYLYIPDDYAKDSSEQWPLILFLHGSGERGDDLSRVKTHGPPKLVAQGKKLPFIIVSPQAKSSGFWKVETLYELLQSLKKQYRVNPDRVYLTGLSMGGYGTWALAARHPEEFAAIAPICGGGDPADAEKLRNIPIWAFHGAKDEVVPLSASEEMVNAAKKYNSDVRLTIYPEANHDSWTATYNNDSLYFWFLKHKRVLHKNISLNAEELKGYAGTFVEGKRDSVKIFVRDGKLFGARGKEADVELHPEAKDLFYIQHNDASTILFTRNKKNQIGGFVVTGLRKMFYRKIGD